MVGPIEINRSASRAADLSLLSLRGLTRQFGGLTAVDAIDLDLGEGELVSIIGPNGAGKTTLFNLIPASTGPMQARFASTGRPSPAFRPRHWHARVSRARSNSVACSAISA
jgi:ABC-type branched-subunit amino acid transport system ATPase component